MHNCKGSIWIIFFRFLLCLWACGCSDDAGMPAPPAGADRVTACVRLSVQVAGETTRAAVQADATVEEKISSVAVFLVSVDGSGKEDWNDVQYEVVYGTTSSAADVYQARIPTTPGKKKVYVGANLLPGQVHAICGQAEGKGLYTAAGAGYDEVIRQFARGTEGIAMTGKAGTSVTVSAPAKDGAAKVAISGNDDLQDGENTITCTVTAEDGETTKTYTIVVTKSDEAASSDEETTADSTETSGGVVGEEGNWTVADTFDDSELPSGFTATEIEYEGRTVKAATDDSGMTLLYMTDDTGKGDFFVYNSETGTLSAYVVVKMAEKTVVVLPPECIPEGTALPDGFAECTIDIGDHTVHGWIWKDSGDSAPEYCVVYGRNENGEEGFYRYDQKEMTLQRYFQDPDAADARSKYLKVAEDYNSLLKDYEIRGMFVIGLFALSILLVIIIIVLLLRKPKAPKRTNGRRRPAYDCHSDGHQHRGVHGRHDADPFFALCGVFVQGPAAAGGGAVSGAGAARRHLRNAHRLLPQGRQPHLGQPRNPGGHRHRRDRRAP